MHPSPEVCFCRRQALKLIERAEQACDEETATILLEAANYWLDQLEALERAGRCDLLIAS